MKLIIDIDEDDYKEIIEEGVAWNCYAMGEAIKNGTVLSEYKEYKKMGMTIDDHIKILKSYYNGFSGWASNFQESIDVALNIMHKYQKIEEIVKNTDAMTGSNGYACAFIDIREVVEDGNDN